MKKIYFWIVFVAFLLAGCSSGGPSTEVLPTVVLDSGSANPASPAETLTPSGEAPASGDVSASGVVTSVRQAQIASLQGGRVEAVLVQSGETVKTGQVLVRLAGSEQQAAAVEAARTELMAAEQALKDIQLNAEQSRAAALLRLANAGKALDDAKKVRGYREYRNGSDSMVASAQADLILATDTLDKAQEAYNYVSKYDDKNLLKAGALSALSNAQKAYDRAVANLNYVSSMPSQVDVDLAEAQLQSAQAEYDIAKREYEELAEGIDPDVLAMAEQRVKNGKAQLAASLSALADVELVAPFDGIAANVKVDSGSWVSPGQTMLIVADLEHLQVETSDLSERDVPSVRVGQPVRVFIKALGQTLEGKVSEISPIAETLGGDVVYTTVISLEEIPASLLIGMSAEVNYLAE
ncbi:HlyD family secretion protein [Ornatilinea apprima]|uniref:HlyD family secretion protein n=1 Tax=Ornatilinea apprima TaxID=1134406 RepID=UPI0009466B4B|nr:efflux RND transporter periplasmic adaptor subunit [Ornatilinea apprima]